MSWRVFLRSSIFAIFLLAIIVFDVNIGHTVPVLGVSFSLALLTVAILSIWRSIGLAFLFALVYGIATDYLAATLFPAHTIAIMISVGIMIFMNRRFFASRALSSFLASVMVMTATYYVVLWALWYLMHIFNNTTLLPLWSAWWPMVALHIVAHPIIAWIWWLVSGRRTLLISTAFSMRS